MALSGHDLERPTEAITEKAGEVAGLSEKARLVETTLEDPEGRREVIDVVELLESVAEEYDDAVAVDLDLPERAPVRAHHQLARAIENVVENSVEHTDRDRASVAFEVTRPDDPEGFVEVEIRDDGPGIPTAEREVLTGEREISQLEHGSGLGLWLVNWIVTASGGEVEFGENDPRGSVVTLRLRAAEGAPGGDERS